MTRITCWGWVLTASSLAGLASGGRADAQGVDKLPAEVAAELKLLASDIGWATANERAYGQQDQRTVRSKESAEGHYKKMVGEAQRLSLNMGGDSFADIQKAAWERSWSAANDRAGYKDDKADNEASYREAIDALRQRGEVTPKLASIVEKVLHYAAWRAQNSVKGYTNDAKSNETDLESWADQLTP